MTTGVETIHLTKISQQNALAIGELMARVWPKPGKDAAYRAARLVEHGQAFNGPAERAPRAFVLRDGEQVLANALMLPRTIHFDQPGSTPIKEFQFGLGGVCSDPDRRGEGLGAAIVRGAFSLIDDGTAPFSLFQTSHKARPFYERLGCSLVENRIVNSLGEDPEANPFWDEIAMRYPASNDWPAGKIDLLGPGY